MTSWNNVRHRKKNTSPLSGLATGTDDTASAEPGPSEAQFYYYYYYEVDILSYHKNSKYASAKIVKAIKS